MEFWQHVLSWLTDSGLQISALKEKDLIFGKFGITYDFTLINHVLLLGRF